MGTGFSVVDLTGELQIVAAVEATALGIVDLVRHCGPFG
jgi:hypothetical protein